MLGLQLQETLDSTRLDLHEQLQQLSSRSRALCQALRGAVDLLLHCIRTISRAASNLSTSNTPGLSGDAEQLLLSTANAEAIAALVDLTVSEVSSHNPNHGWYHALTWTSLNSEAQTMTVQQWH